MGHGSLTGLRIVRTLLLLASPLLPAGMAASQTPDDAEYARGTALMAKLSAKATDSAADQEVFRSFGTAEAEKALMAVAIHDQRPEATTADWATMHRAYDALIEVAAGDQKYLLASIYANLQDQAYAHCEGDYVSATAAARRAVELEQRSGTGDGIPIPWVNLGNDLIRLGQIDDGLAQLRHAESTIQDTTSPLAAEIHGNIIAAEWSRSNAAAAQSELGAFLALATPSVPAAFRGSALLAEASIEIGEHRYDDATAHIHQALSAIKGTPDALTVAYMALDELLSMALEAVESMPYDQAMALCKHLDGDFASLPISISGFAHEIENHRRRLAGQFDAVLRDDAATLAKAKENNNIEGQVSALLSTALDYAYLRDSRQELSSLTGAAEILHGSDSTAIPALLRYRVLNALGGAALTIGDADAARTAYTETADGIAAVQSAQQRAELSTLYGDAQLGIAAAKEKAGDLNGAREMLKQAINPAAGSLGKFTASTVLLQSAKLEQNAGQPPAVVVPIYLGGLAALHQKDANSEVYARLQFVQYLAEHLASGPAPEPSLAMARQQLDLARTAATSVTLADAGWRILFLEGLLDEDAGNLAGATASYAAAVDALNRIRTGLSEPEERASFIDGSTVQDLYRHQIQVLTGQMDREGAWRSLEGDKARTFLESLDGRRFVSAARPSAAPGTASAHARPSNDLAALEQQILNVRLSLSSESDATLRSSGRTPEVVRGQLASLEDQFALARREQTLVESRATQPLSLSPVSLAATQLKLPAHTALIEYAILDKQLAAFVVTRASSQELHWPADTAKLPAQMQALSTALASMRVSQDSLDRQLAAASDTLLLPVLSALPADIDTLVIVPTQSIALIPFQALPLPATPAQARGFSDEPSADDAALADLAPQLLLIDRFAVTYLPSASTLQFLHFGLTSASSDLYLGAIGDVSVEGLPPLPGTLSETAVIQRLYPHAARETGAAFTHDAAVRALQQHEEVHFATHGLFDPHAPLFSALLTAPSPDAPDRLSLYELTDLNLKARLVILSACETDRGQINGGDEIEGLTRTFLQAGAENVVSSLWSVNDESTALLMESLHAHLRAGETAPLALRHAELQVRRKYPQPYYWAAFVDTGVR